MNYHIIQVILACIKRNIRVLFLHNKRKFFLSIIHFFLRNAEISIYNYDKIKAYLKLELRDLSSVKYIFLGYIFFEMET